VKKVFITHHQIISPLGFDSASNFENLKLKKSGLKELQRRNGDTYVGAKIDEEKLNTAFSEIGNSESFTKLEKMMLLIIQNILDASNFKITSTTGLIISTTKGNVACLDPNSPFYKDEKRAYLPTLGKVIQTFFNFKEEAIMLSNACVSGVLAISVASRLIKQDAYKDVIVVSGDLVSEFILSGFTSFQAISNQLCKPYSKNRTGINIGEVAAGVLMTGDITQLAENSVEIIGSASCNDANHISGPSRTGEGLVLSIESAVKEASIDLQEIDYISAHGTATAFNDEMESVAMGRLGLTNVPLNSLKGYYGHTLGSSGLLESIIGIASLNQNTLIASLGYDENGVTNELNIIRETEVKPLNIFLKTASGFGGCNTAVIFKKLTTNG